MNRPSNKYKMKPSFLEIAFAEIMPEVKFIDCTPITEKDIAGGARKKLEARLGRSVVSKKNFLPRRQAGLKNPEDKK